MKNSYLYCIFCLHYNLKNSNLDLSPLTKNRVKKTRTPRASDFYFFSSGAFFIPAEIPRV